MPINPTSAAGPQEGAWNDQSADAKKKYFEDIQAAAADDSAFDVMQFTQKQIWDHNYADLIADRFPDCTPAQHLRICKKLYGDFWLNSYPELRTLIDLMIWG